MSNASTCSVRFASPGSKVQSDVIQTLTIRSLALAALASLAAILLNAGVAQAAQLNTDELEQFALRNAGSSEKGKALFADMARTKCIACHRVGKQGGEIGPDLSSIGGKFDRPHLIESLLEPSKQIVEGYRSSSVLLNDGRVFKGVIRERTDEAITLADKDAKLHVIQRSTIDALRDDKLSVMPTGLADNLSAEEFTDLLAYLETLRSGGKSGAGSEISGPINLSDDFDVRTIATNLSGGTAMEVLDDGRILVCEQIGTVRVIKDGVLLERPMIELDVDHLWERGVIGVTTDPKFPERPFVYICWTNKAPFSHHRISRFTVTGDVADPSSELVLLEGDDQSKMGGNVPAGHQGGALHFGPDGKLYIAIGEQTAGSPSQDLDTFLGKMLRIDSDGSIPSDNPLLNKTTGKYQAIWAYGMRNPFTFAIRDDGLMLINDVGGKFEEINVGVAGGNFGWPIIQHGRVQKPEFQDPIHWYPEASISGGDFLTEEMAKAGNWPTKFAGRYFFADFKHGWLHTIDPDNARKADDFASGLRRPVDLRFSGDGTLYVLLRNAWVIDDKFQGGTSSLLAIQPK